MIVEELQKIFPQNVPIPGILTQLANRCDETGEYLSCDFELAGSGNDDALAWFSDDQEAASQFLIFGNDGMHSLYGYWLYDGKTIADAPIVYLNGEGADNTVLANNLEEFVALLTVGKECVGLYQSWDESQEPCPGIEDFRNWASSQLNIAVPDDPRDLIERAKRRHPDLDKWVQDYISQKGGN
jgi:hypothetical protein